MDELMFYINVKLNDKILNEHFYNDKSVKVHPL